MPSKKVYSTLLAALLIILATASLAMADAYHYRNIIVGERASGLSGAYTAVSDDPSGLFYNPAGIVYSSGSNLSASVNAYHSTGITYKSALGGSDWNRKAAALLPNFFGVVQTIGKGRVGLSYVVPDSIIEDQDQVFHNLPGRLDLNNDGTYETPVTATDYVINFNNEDNTYYFGPSYAIELKPGLSVGATLYYHYRKNQRILNEYIAYDSGHYDWVGSYYETSEWGLRPSVGVIWSPVDKVSLGFTASTTKVMGSDTSAQVTSKRHYTNTALFQMAESSEEREYPYVFTVGAAYFPNDALMVSGDINYFTSTEDKFLGEREATVNMALGAEYYVTPKIAIRGGMYTNLTSAPGIDYWRTDQPEHVDLYGGSLSMSYFGRGASLTLGGVYSFGKGEAQVIGGSTATQDAEMTSWTMLLSTSYSY